MNNFYNPFRQNRTEQMVDLSKYYVPFDHIQFEAKPLVISGGRGSGKTMLFKCNSWPERLSICSTIDDFLKQNDFVGIYYRCDASFVSDMQGKDRDDWKGVFNTYLSTMLIKDIVKFLERTQSGYLDYTDKTLKVISSICSTLSFEETKFMDFTKCIEFLDAVLDNVQYICNYPHGSNINFKKTNIGIPVKNLIENLREIKPFSSLNFRVFIDEFETLTEYQQEVVNTLIKNSSHDLTYNIGTKQMGQKTLSVSGTYESIQAPHDFDTIHLDSDDLFSDEQLIQICKNRFNYAIGKGLLPSTIDTNIGFYLGKYDSDYELELLEKSKLLKVSKFTSKLEKIIENYTTNQIEQDELKSILIKNSRLMNVRLHYAVLCRVDKHRPDIHDLSKYYLDWKSDNNDNSSNSKNPYSDWVHNAKFGIIFNLAKKNKLYYGFDVYRMISSGTVRYFLELCEQAFDNADLYDNFDWITPKPISPDAQTKAAKYLSYYKFTDLDTYQPYGNEISMFIKYLATLFAELHQDDDATFGEPEINHFHTDFAQLNEDTKTKIKSALMWNVLQSEMPTKEKAKPLSLENYDFLLNRIYTPYYNISYRKKRKIYIDPSILQDLLSGEHEKAKKAFNTLKQKRLKNLPMVSSNSVDDVDQISFFEVK